MLAVTAKVVFAFYFSKCLCQSKAVPASHPKLIIPLFRAVVTVMAKIHSTNVLLVLINRLGPVQFAVWPF